MTLGLSLLKESVPVPRLERLAVDVGELELFGEIRVAVLKSGQENSLEGHSGDGVFALCSLAAEHPGAHHKSADCPRVTELHAHELFECFQFVHLNSEIFESIVDSLCKGVSRAHQSTISVSGLARSYPLALNGKIVLCVFL